MRGSLPLFVAGASTLLVGLALRPRAVEVSIQARGDASRVYWHGNLPEPRVPDGGFFLQKLQNHYRSPPLPFPARTPPYRVRFDMHIVARADGEYGFELDTPWDGAVDIDGERVLGVGPFGPTRSGAVSLSAGVHRVVMSTQPAGDPDQPMRLLWSEPGGRLRPVNRHDLTLAASPRRYAVAALLATPLLWLGALLMALSTVLWLRGADHGARRDRVLALVLVMGVGFVARLAHFETYPRLRLDESHNAWAGFNLVHEGHPRSWSWLPVYDNTRVEWFSYSYPMVPDTFDHPPLLPLLVGLEATLLGAETMFEATLPRIRPLMLVFGTLTVGLLFLVALEVTSFRTAFLAGTVTAVAPLVVFNSRLAKEDGLVQFLLLLAIYAYVSGRRASSLWGAGLASGLAAASKMMGAAVGFGLAAVTFAEGPTSDAETYRHRLGRASIVLGVTLLLAAVYPLYGHVLDGETYRRVTSYLAATYSIEPFAEKFLILPRLIVEPRVTAATPLIDGWVLLGWLSVFHLFRNRAIGVSFVCYLLALMMSVSSQNIWGFYLLPLMPLLCLAAAITIERALTRPNVVTVFFVIALGFLPQYAMLEGAPRPGGFRGVAMLAFLPLIPATLRLGASHPLTRIGRVLLLAMVVLGVLASLHRTLTTL